MTKSRPWLIATLGGGALASALVVAALVSVEDDDEPRALPTQLTTVEPRIAPAPGQESESAIAVDAPDPERPVSGCGVAGNSGTTTMLLPEGSYLLNAPPGYDPDEKHPIIVILFNDLFRTPHKFLQSTGLTTLAEREGLLLIAPLFDDMDVEPTISLTVAAIEETRRTRCVDNERLYVIGHGNGGRCARELRCRIPLSALATSGSGQSADEEVCQTEPTPFIRLHGLHDTRVPYHGGKGCYTGPFLSSAAVEAAWASRNDCEGRPRTFAEQGKSSCRIWKCAAAVASCALDGGHDWPGAEARINVPGCRNSPPDFPMRETTWRFFEEHGRLLKPLVPPPATQ